MSDGEGNGRVQKRDHKLLAIARKIALDERSAFHSTSTTAFVPPKPGQAMSSPTRRVVSVSTLEIVDALHGKTGKKRIVYTEEEKRIMEEKRKRIEKAQKTLALIADPNNTELYSMGTEREVMTTYRFTNIIPEMEKASKRKANVKGLAKVIKQEMIAALYGCDVNVGIYTDSEGSAIEFLSDSDYVRVEYRGKSTCFECIDQKDIVLQTTTKTAKQKGLGFTSGETVVYVPLLGKGGGVGVLEIHGLFSDGITDNTSFERPVQAIKSMIDAKDYKFTETVRLWRLPSGRSGGLAQVSRTDFNKAQYQIVCGKVTGIATEKNGIPYYGGARYTITWEDGLVEDGLTATEFLKLYAQTPQSLGCCTELNPILTETLLKLGEDIGEMLEAQRARDAMNFLGKRLHYSNLSDVEIADRSFDTILTTIRGIRECGFIGYNNSSNEHVVLTQKQYAIKAADKKRTQSINSVISKYNELKLTNNNDGSFNPLIIDEGLSQEWVLFSIPLPANYHWKGSHDYIRFYVYMVRSKHPISAVAALELSLYCSLINTFLQAINYSWEKHARNIVRKELQRTIETKVGEWRLLSVDEMCHNVISSIVHILPGANVYIGVIEKMSLNIQFVACNETSQMVGKALSPGEGMSNEIIARVATAIIKDEDMDKISKLKEGTLCQVYYGKKLYPAKITKVCGHEKYNIVYLNEGSDDESNSKESGVDISRIIPSHLAFQMKRFGAIELPYVCIPLRNRNKGIGVLCLETLNKIPRAPYDDQPEPGLLKFLESVGRIIGSTIDVQRKKSSLKKLSLIATNKNSTVEDIFEGAVTCIKENLYFCEGIVAGRLVYEMLEVSKGFRVVQAIGRHLVEIEHSIHAYDPHKMSQKPIQVKNEKNIWMLMKLRSHIVEGKIYIMVIRTKIPISDPDLEFLDTIQKIVLSALQSLDSSEEQGEVKQTVLTNVERICSEYRKYSREEFYNLIMDQFSAVFLSANVYIGKLEMHNKEIRYIYASKKSSMLGKALKRDSKKGISFKATDTLSRLGVTQSSVLADSLHHFGRREMFEFPFIVIPLVVHIDSAIGILAADSCDDPAADSDRVDDVVNYVGRITSSIAPVLRQYFIEDSINEIKLAVRTAVNSKDGFKLLKKVLLTNLPYAMRVADVILEPKEDDKLRMSRGKALPVTKDDYLIVFQFIKGEIVSKLVSGITMSAFWQGKSVYKSKVKGEMDKTVLSFRVNKGTEIDSISLSLVLNGVNNGASTDICKRNITLRYMVNSPLYIQEHYFDSLNVKDYHVASVQMISKVFNLNQPVAITLSSIDLSNLKRLDNNKGESFVLVKWNDLELCKTPGLKSDDGAVGGNCSWKNLAVNLNFSSVEEEQLNKDILVLEVWNQDFVGRGKFLGRYEITAKQILDIFSGKSKGDKVWFELGEHPTLSSGQQKHVGGKISINGTKLFAYQMTQAQILQELDTNHIASEAADGPGEGDENVTQNAKKDINMCEVIILSARELGRNRNWVGSESNPFVICYFNGEEVGRTAAASGTSNPSWEDESFSVEAPGFEELESCILSFEIFDMSFSGFENFLGIVEISGKALVNLLYGTSLKTQWYDVTRKRGYKSDQSHVTGELKIAGRPMNIKVTGDEEGAKELGMLTLQLVSLLPKLPAPGDGNVRVLVTFNGKVVCTTKKVKLDAAGATFDEAAVAIRVPNNISIYQSELVVEVFSEAEFKNVQSMKVLVPQTQTNVNVCTLSPDAYCSVKITGLSLIKLLGQKGIKSYWFQAVKPSLAIQMNSAVPIASMSNAAPADESVSVCNVKIKGGPSGSKEIHDYDGRVVWLDILAAAIVHSNKLHHDTHHEERRTSTLCEIYWNNLIIGRTNVARNTYNPIWEKQRFLVQIPLIDGVSDSIPLCELELKLFDSTDHDKVYLGSVVLKKEKLSNFINGKSAQVCWFDVLSTANDLAGQLKMRGGLKGVSLAQTHTNEFKEFRLDIIGASGIAKCDKFRNNNPYATVEWNGEELGKTFTIKNSMTPLFQNESFILRVPKGGDLSKMTLNISLWDNNFKSGSDFLGCYIVDGEKWSSVLNNANAAAIKDCSLEQSPDLTEEENGFAGGVLRIRLYPLNYDHLEKEVITFRNSLLWIRNCRSLNKANLYGPGSDPYCVLYRSSVTEGVVNEEIHRTKVVYKTLNPVFLDEKVVFKIPTTDSDDEWHGLSLKIEVWHNGGGDFLGMLVLDGIQLRALLSGNNSTKCLELNSFDLVSNNEFTNKLNSLVGGQIGLSGGLLAYYDKNPGYDKDKDDSMVNIVPVSTSSMQSKNKWNEISASATKPNPLQLDDATPDKNDTSQPSVAQNDALPEVDENGEVVRISVNKCDNLAKVKSSMLSLTGTTNAMCVVKWNNKEVGRTESIKGTNNPKWGDGVSKMDISFRLPSEIQDLVSCSLTIEVWHVHKDTNDILFLLGQATISKNQLVELLTTNIETDVVTTLDLRKKDNSKMLSPRSNKVDAKGTVTFTVSREQAKMKGVKQDEALLLNPNLKALQLELTILKCVNITGKVKNIYAKVYWYKPSSLVSSTNAYSVESNNQSVFDNEAIPLEKPEGITLRNDCSLKIEIIAKSNFRKEEVLGELTLEGGKLIDFINNSMLTDIDSLLANSNDEKLTFVLNSSSPNVRGSSNFSLIMAMRQVKRHSPVIDGNPNFDLSLPLPYGMKEIEITVLAAQGLVKANMFGKSDPFCLLKLDGVDIGKTSVITETLDPVWEEDQTFIFRAYSSLGSSEQERKNLQNKKLKDLQKKQAAALEIAGSIEVTDELSLVPDDLVEAEHDHVLTVDIYDWNRVGKGVFLGCVELSGNELHNFANFKDSKLNRKWFNLGKTRRFKGAEQRLDIQGKVELMVGPRKSKKDIEEGKEIEVEICSCRGLAKADTFGSADPFVKVRFNNKMVGKTEVVKNSLTPTWTDNNMFTIRIPASFDVSDCVLYLEVWDWDLAGTNSFLGSLTIKGNGLKAFVEDSLFAPLWFKLGRSEYLDDSEQELVQGEVQLRCGYKGNTDIPPENAVIYEIVVSSAHGLSAADGGGLFGGPGLSDPFAILKWNGREVGKTQYISKTLNPVWDVETSTFRIILHEKDKIENNVMQVDVYDYNLLKKGVFLGCLILKGEELLEFLNNNNVNPEEQRLRTFDLAPDPYIDEKSLKVPIQGKIVLAVRKVDESKDETGAPSIDLKWHSEVHKDAGYPVLELSVISAQSLSVAKVISGSQCNPFCVVTWLDEEIGSTNAVSGLNPTWHKERFILTIPHNVDKLICEYLNRNLGGEGSDHSCPFLQIDVWDKETIGKGEYLGQIRLSFADMLFLYDGAFQLQLQPSSLRDKSQFVRGSLTIGLKFLYPFYDTIKTHLPKKMVRRIRIVSGYNFPMINGEAPSTKGVLFYKGANKLKTMVVNRNTAPTWSQAQVEEIIDIHNPIDVIVYVYHVDIVGKREICLGQVHIPFENIVRPSTDGFDLPLAPPSKKPPNKYKFVVSGSVKVHISNPVGVTDSHTASWSSHFELPVNGLVCSDALAARKLSKEDMQYDGEHLTPAELSWFGALVDYSTIQSMNICNKPQWIILPIRDMGIQIGKNAMDFIGTKPGTRYSWVVERQSNKLCVSDVSMLEEIRDSLQYGIIKLRRKELCSRLRQLTLKRYTTALRDYMKSGGNISIASLPKWIVKAVRLCFPSAIIYTATISPDLKSLNGVLYESDGSTRNVTWYAGQGLEWELSGRYFPKSIVIKSVKDLLPKSGTARIVTTHRPFANSCFPRILVPFFSGDAAMGFFGVENFSVFNGGFYEEDGGISNESECKQWFETMGNMIGDAMYSGREAFAISEIEAYVNGYNSTYTGMIQAILRCCVNVLQGCKMMEVWSIDMDYRIKSLAYHLPTSVVPSGRMVVLSLSVVKKHNQTINDSGEVTSGLAVAVSDEVASKPPAKTNLICGVRYDNSEQATLLHRADASSADGNIRYNLPPINVLITNDRNIYISIYEVDDSVKILHEYYGKISLISFQETAFHLTLSAHKTVSLHNAYDVSVALAWPSDSDMTAASSFDVKTIKSFGISVKSCMELYEVNPGSNKKFDVFAEIHHAGKLVTKTSVKKGVVNCCDFNENFIIPFTGKRAPVIIELYEMTLIGKGSFRGKVEIPFDQLLTPPPNEIDFPLQHKMGVNAKKQTLVGGKLSILYELDLLKTATASDQAENDIKLVTIPRAMWSMSTPAVSITIKSCSNLSKANLFGGSSDPFVMIYLSTDEDPICKSKVIDNNLDPVFNETFVINFGVHMTPDTTTIKDFPTVRLEVWDYNNFAAGEFLGCVELTPAYYFSKKGGELPLGPSPKLTDKKNKLATQGLINFGLEIVDNVASINSQKYFWREWKRPSSDSVFRTLPMNLFIEVHILKCRNLMSANRFGGKSDPFVVVKWNDVVWGETAVRKDTLDPTWNDERFVVNINSAAFLVPELVLEVWDKNFFTQGEFLGEIRLSGVEFLHPVVGIQEMELLNKPGRFKGKVKGTLSFKLVERWMAQRVLCSAKEYQEIKLIDAQFSPLDISVVRDPEEEARRQKVEMSQLPSLVRKVKQKMDTYLSKPFERTGLISELHFGQLVSSCKRSEHTVLKTDLAEMFCAPTTFTEINDNHELLYVVSRYSNGHLSRRDAEFLVKVKDILVKGLEGVSQRDKRIKLRQTLERNLKHINGVADSIEGLLDQGILEVENALQCKARIFVLNAADGKSYIDAFNKDSEIVLDTESFGGFVNSACKLCRHGYILQYYNGTMTVLDPTWTSTSQMAAMPLDSVTDLFDEIEGKGASKRLISQASKYGKDGVFFIPLMTPNEVMTAVMVVEKANNIPFATYRYRPIGDLAKKYSTAADYVDLKAPEEGITDSLVQIATDLGKALLAARLSDGLKRLRGFYVSGKTEVNDILRIAFRMLSTAIPGIREISIWAIDINNTSASSSTGATAQSKKGGLFSSLFNTNKSGAFSSVTRSDSIQMIKSYSESSIQTGYFGSEDPLQLLSTPLEKAEVKIFSVHLAKQMKSVLVKRDEYRRNAAITDNKDGNSNAPSQADIIRQAVEKHEANSASEWTVNVPTVFKVNMSNKDILAHLGTIKGDNEIAKTASSKWKDLAEARGDDSGSSSDDESQKKSNSTTLFLNQDAVSTIHSETRRCINTLNYKTFRTKTGHVLSLLGNSDYTQSVFDALFDPDYAATRAEELQQKRLKIMLKKQKKTEELEKLRADRRKELGMQPINNDNNDAVGGFNLDSDSDDDELDNKKRIEKKVAAMRKKGINPKPPADGSTVSPRNGEHIAGTTNIDRKISEVPTNKPPATAPLPSGPPPASIVKSTEKLNRKYFLSINTHGIGDDSGWGNLGDTTVAAIEGFASWIDSAITKANEDKVQFEKMLNERLEKEYKEMADNSAKASIEDTSVDSPEKSKSKKSKKKKQKNSGESDESGRDSSPAKVKVSKKKGK